LVRFSTSLFAIKDEFETDRFLQLKAERGLSHVLLCDTIERLSTAQLRSVVEAWPTDEKSEGKRKLGIHRFVILAGDINPSATIPLMYDLRDEWGETNVPGSARETFQYWFRHDSEGLLKWAMQAGMPEGFEDGCAIWADAALVARAPSVENVRKLISHKTNWAWAQIEAVSKLATSEARLTFFQNLHIATGGVYNDLGPLVRKLSERIPFAQLAYLADTAPTFQTSQPQRSGGLNTGGPEDQLGSLRLEVAAHSRDGTAAQRWNWLTQRSEDHPSDKLFGRLVDAWCKSDYAETAAWIRSLPPGYDRDMATKAVIAFLEYNGAPQFVLEWKRQ
jgi:hypothetical protein